MTYIASMSLILAFLQPIRLSSSSLDVCICYYCCLVCMYMYGIKIPGPVVLHGTDEDLTGRS